MVEEGGELVGGDGGGERSFSNSSSSSDSSGRSVSGGRGGRGGGRASSKSTLGPEAVGLVRLGYFRSNRSSSSPEHDRKEICSL